MQSPVQLLKHDGPVQPNSYIVKLKDDVSLTDHFDLLNNSKSQITSCIEHEYHRDVFNGYSATLTDEELDFVLHCGHAELVTENGYFSALVDPDDSSEVTEMEFPEDEEQAVGLEALQDVDVYMFGTGIYLEHACFGDRARWGANFTTDADDDRNGHGTHTAGIAVGGIFGQATAAKVIAVKVLGDNASGSTSGIIAGINWAVRQVKASGRPSIANMSIGGSPNAALDNAVRNAIREGLSVVVGAGNDNQDLSRFSPARVLEANTVGAVDYNRRKASFSNFGPTLKVWAPGTDILSAWINGPSSVKRLSGSAMAAPRVTGYMAIALGRQNLPPQSLTEELIKHAEPVVTGVPPGTTNLLARSW